MSSNNQQDKFQQAKDIKSQSIDGLRQLCESFANVRTVINDYTQGHETNTSASDLNQL